MRIQKRYPTKLNTKRHMFFRLLVPNILLAVLTAGLLFAAVAYFDTLSRTEIRGDNRFLTMEWQLLQELKAETDRQLSQKDREIHDLRARYALLKLQNLSPVELADLEEEIRKAEAERETLVSKLFSTGAGSTASGTPSSAGQPQAGGFDIVSALYRQRIRDLEGLLAAKAASSAPVPAPALIAAADTSAADTSAALRGFLERKIRELEQAPAPRFEDLKTRTLLRAIASAPAIRADYPDLLEKTDRYLESSAVLEQAKGRKEAFSEVLGEISRGY